MVASAIASVSVGQEHVVRRICPVFIADTR